MTKRRDRNRKVRRRRRVYIWHWSEPKEHAVARIIASRILHTTNNREKEH